MSKKGDIKIITYLDWSDMRCPCGEEISGRYCSGQDWQDFIDKHKEHSSGKSTRHYDPEASLKVFTDVPKREVKEL